MKKVSVLIAVVFMSVLSIQAQKTTWSFDNSHSKVSFDVAHMVISELTGQFQEYEGTVMSDAKDFSDAKVNFTIKVASIDTDDKERDGHLTSADFFDTEKYPSITFVSKSMKKSGDNTYVMAGDLTMHGVTKTVNLDVTYGGTINDPWGNTKAGFKITGELDRTEFGLKYNSVMDSGGFMIGEEVTINCNVELMKQK